MPCGAKAHLFLLWIKTAILYNMYLEEESYAQSLEMQLHAYFLGSEKDMVRAWEMPFTSCRLVFRKPNHLMDWQPNLAPK